MVLTEGFKHAVVVVDLVEDYFTKDKVPLKDRKQLIENVNHLTGMARAVGAPVIWVKQRFKSDLSDAYVGLRRSGKQITVEGTFGAQPLTGLNIQYSDYDIIKKRYSAFFGTNLKEVLDSHGVNSPIFAGAETHVCVRASVTDAYQHDYPNIIIAGDCIYSHKPDNARMALTEMTNHMACLMTNSELMRTLKPH